MSKTRNVKDLMNPDIMTVADDMTTNELARYLIEREISGAPVVDSEGHLIGVVSMTDIGRNVAEPSDDESPRGSSFYGDIAADLTLEDLGQRYVEERAVTVRDVMTMAPKTVWEDTTIQSALLTMRTGRFRRLPVVGRTNRLLGLLTLDDVLMLLSEEFTQIGRLLQRETPQAVVENQDASRIARLQSETRLGVGD